MSYWNWKIGKVISFEPKPYPGYPKWEMIDCGCCAGIQWGGEEPIECKKCGGNGALARHIKTGLLACYPGGKFIG